MNNYTCKTGKIANKIANKMRKKKYGKNGKIGQMCRNTGFFEL